MTPVELAPCPHGRPPMSCESCLLATVRLERAAAEAEVTRLRLDNDAAFAESQALRARLALAERVVEAATVVILGNHACVEKRAPYGCEFCDALRAALAAWREGGPHPSLNVAICPTCGGFGGVLLDGPNGVQKMLCACGGRKP